MELIGGPTGGQISSATSSITFSNIPQTYTDLVLKVSARTTFSSTSDFNIEPNGSAANLTGKRIYGTGTSVLSDSATWELTNGTDTTSNTFINTEVYFPNYASSNYKSFSSDGVMENNATFAYSYIMSHLWANNTPISSLTIRSGAGNFVEGSTFYLYGISNVTSTTKATGGIVSSDGTYNYHMFPFSGTFTPTTAISADVLVIAGGGGANAGGGGAGGVLYSASQSLSTAQTITIGAGGVGGTGGYPVGPGNNGGNSYCGSLTATGGGGGGGYNSSATLGAGNNGGSGGGAGTNATGGTANAGIGTSGQGNNGGVSTFGTTAPYSGAGGGGAGGVGGTTAAADRAGLGGIGTVTFASWANATQTGANNGYYAGGGGGGSYGLYSGSTPGTGGLGGGGACTAGNPGTNGLANTGGGGGGGNGGTGASGGSGLVIIRYAI